MIGETVTAWCTSDGTGELRGTVARLEEASYAARAVPRRDGRADSVAPTGGAGRASPSQTRIRSPTAPAWGDAARTPPAVDLQPQRPRHGGPALRRGIGEAFRGAAVGGWAARRLDEPELAPPVGEARFGREAVRADQPAPGLAWALVEDRGDRGRDPQPRAVVDEEPQGRAGPGDARDKEGQPGVLRDEGACRRGRGLGDAPQRSDDTGERVRRGDRPRAVARGR